MGRKLSALAEKYRSRIVLKELQVYGRNGHLYEDGGRLMICFTDDGRRKPLTGLEKGAALRALGSLVRITQEGDFEFVGELLGDEAVGPALRVLGVPKLALKNQ